MKIAFFIDNSNLPKTDYSKPFEGSPGIGASLYIPVAIPFCLDRYSPNFANLLLLAPHTAHLPKNIQTMQSGKIIDVASAAKEWGADFFVFRFLYNDLLKSDNLRFEDTSLKQVLTSSLLQSRQLPFLFSHEGAISVSLVTQTRLSKLIEF